MNVAEEWGTRLKLRDILTSGLLYFALASSADALCVYHGALYAKTTLAQEFRDSAFVIRGTVLSSREIPLLDNNTDPGAEPGVVYRVRVEQSFKGALPDQILNYSERDSGGFYLDAGTEYVLFLNPMARDDRARKRAPGALRVNYSCGQSLPWKDEPIKARAQLEALSINEKSD